MRRRANGLPLVLDNAIPPQLRGAQWVAAPIKKVGFDE
jgi:hypothetical protein